MSTYVLYISPYDTTTGKHSIREGNVVEVEKEAGEKTRLEVEKGGLFSVL
jgi:hypothetical protein